jgi:hypothetical protein
MINHKFNDNFRSHIIFRMIKEYYSVKWNEIVRLIMRGKIVFLGKDNFTPHNMLKDNFAPHNKPNDRGSFSQ